MADNILVSPGTGATIAADDIGGVLHQRVKLSQGADGSATDVSSAAPLQVTLANTGANATPVVVDLGANNDVSLNAGTNYVGKVRITDGTTDSEVVPLAGYNAQAVAIVDGSGSQITSFGGGVQYTEGDVDATFTGTMMLAEAAGNTAAALQIDASGHLQVDLAAASTSITVSDGGGSITVDNNGTFAVQSTNQANSGVDIGDVTINNAAGASAVNIQDGGNSITVDGTFWQATQPVSGTVTANAGTGTMAVSNTVLSVVGGGTEATAQRVTIASDSTGVLSVDDNGGSLTVDGTVTANAGTGTFAVSMATNTPLGTVAHDSADSGAPIKVGGRAVSAEITPVTTGDRSDFITDLAGKQVMMPYANNENFVSGAITTAMTGTTSTSLVAAPAAGLRNYITTIIVSNSHGTVGTDVVIQDGSGGTTLMTIPAAAVYGGAVINLPVPLRQPTTATAIYCANVTTGASTKVSAVGYKGY